MNSKPNRTLELDEQAIAALVTELADWAEALAAVHEYATADDLSAPHFGNLASRHGVGAAFVEVRDALADSVGKVGPAIESMSRVVADSANALRAADADAAARLNRIRGD